MNTLKKKKSKVEEFQEFPGGPVVGLQALTVCLRHSFSLCSGNLNSHKPHGAAKKKKKKIEEFQKESFINCAKYDSEVDGKGCSAEKRPLVVPFKGIGLIVLAIWSQVTMDLKSKCAAKRKLETLSIDNLLENCLSEED